MTTVCSLSTQREAVQPQVSTAALTQLVIQLDDKIIACQQGKALIDQLRRDDKREPIPVTLSIKDGQVCITPADCYGRTFLYAPTNFETKELQADIGIAGFGFCEAANGKVLFIQRKRDNKWYIPGGLMEKSDTDLWRAATREIKEETGVEVAGEGTLSYLYNSILPRRQNLMVVYFNALCWTTAFQLDRSADLF